MPLPERHLSRRSAVAVLFGKECRNLASGRAFWILLAPLVGYSYIQAVALYAEASQSAGQLPEVARNLSPLDGILVPAFGALYLGQCQTAAGVAEHAKSLYGERYGEFLDNVKAFAYFPYAVATRVEDFRQGEISLRFKPLSGRMDQGVGILFNLKPNGDYLTVRANAPENNLVLWKCEKGRRSSVKWVRDVPTPSKTWHDLKVVINGNTVEGYLNGKLHLTHQLPEPVSGKIGVWSKADSHMYIYDYRVVGDS